MPGPHRVPAGGLPGPDQVRGGFLRLGQHPRSGRFTDPQQPGQTTRRHDDRFDPILRRASSFEAPPPRAAPLGCIDVDTYRKAEHAGRVAQDIPVNHSPSFAPVIQPTCDTGTQALVVAALAWLDR